MMHPLSWHHRSFCGEALLPSGRLVGGVASPDLGGGQVAVLRPHAASASHVTAAVYPCVREVYVPRSTKYSTALSKANFLELRQGEVRRIPLPRTPVNRRDRRSLDGPLPATEYLDLGLEEGQHEPRAVASVFEHGG